MQNPKADTDTDIKKSRTWRGSIVFLLAIMMPALLLFAMLTIDLGHLIVVKQELQNASDAAALAGAGSLSSGLTYPNWTASQSAATTAIRLNKSDGVTLIDGQVEAGYWNLAAPAPQSISQTLPQSCVTAPASCFYKPAVQVTISRSENNNGGSMPLFFGPIFGLPGIPVTASAVSIISPPGTANPPALFPVAISQCLFDHYWDSATGKPKNDPATGLPYEFQIGSSYQYSACGSGNWTSFTLGVNDVTTIRDLIHNGNPITVNIGDNIWLQPGVKNTIYSSVTVPSDVLISVVTDVTTKVFKPILAFAPFHITASVGGSGKYIGGHFTSNFNAAGTSPGAGTGTYYGAFSPPMLAK